MASFYASVVLRRALSFAHADKIAEDIPVFGVETYCFDKQIAFIRDPARFKTAVCSRRSGKTISCAADLIDTCVSTPNINCVYISKTRGSSKRIIWKELLHINKIYSLNAKIDNTDLCLTFPNGSMLYLTGAKDSTEIDKFRGMALKKVYIDECQSFPAYLKDLVDDVLVPSLIDHQGSLILIGTPSATCAGIFYAASNSADSDYSHHNWTFRDNPFLLAKAQAANPEIKTADDILNFELRRRRTTIDDPAIGREWLGLWLRDMTLAVYKFDRELNTYDYLPSWPWHYVIGYDLGFDDSDAGVVLAYHKHSPAIYLVDEFKISKQDISSLAAKMIEWDKKYDPQRTVIDTGGLGKKITEELKKRFGLALDPADKVRKKEFIELMNSDMKLGKIKVPKNAMVISEWELLQWDAEEMAKNKWVEDSSFENHISDAFLYNFRECYHFMQEEVVIKAEPFSDRWYKEKEQELIANVENQLRMRQEEY